ncbi:conserved hypothetical protein [Paraburkholderia caribensis]|nr:conserved hypothetical protein [Paraburkholderia caribensis]
MTVRQVIPDDFPRESASGSVAGAQPKLLVREIDGRYRSGLTDDELWTRYDACEDLAGQLVGYASRKMSEFGLSLEDALRRVETGLEAKVASGQWILSRGELAWLMRRTHELLLDTANGEEDGNMSR